MAKGKIIKEYHVRCGVQATKHCYLTTTLDHDASTMSWAQKGFRHLGWRDQRGHGWTCPSCVQHLKKVRTAAAERARLGAVDQYGD